MIIGIFIGIVIGYILFPFTLYPIRVINEIFIQPYLPERKAHFIRILRDIQLDKVLIKSGALCQLHGDTCYVSRRDNNFKEQLFGLEEGIIPLFYYESFPEGSYKFE